MTGDEVPNPALEALMSARPNMPTEVLDDLAALFRRPDWHQDAACRGAGPAMFYPGQGDDIGPAMAVCGTCTVTGPCRDAALDDGYHQFGVWGGLSPNQRKDQRRPIRSSGRRPAPSGDGAEPAA